MGGPPVQGRHEGGSTSSWLDPSKLKGQQDLKKPKEIRENKSIKIVD